MRLTVLAMLLLLFLLNAAWADVGGKITGLVKDQTDAVIAGATVVAANAATGVKQTTKTDEQGNYTFPVLPVGQYVIEVTADGFKPYKTRGFTIDINTALTVDVTMQVSDQNETVTVTDGAAHVETSDTQLGQVINSQQITSIPLNGRSYTDLFATQVGVTPLTTSGAGNSTSGGGFGTVPAAGNADTGQISINGQRESANGFTLNGVSVQETIGQQAGIIPNLDSIAQFRILNSNADAEYGNYSGGLISVVTKSGANQLHGDAFEFLRNTALDARGFFDPGRSTFQQNQFGGTLGGPIKKDKVFFFVDYQGQRTVQGVETGIVSVPSLANRAGDFSDSANTLTGKVNGAFLAQTLANRLGYGVAVGEPFFTSGCASNTQCVFPGAKLPQSAFGAPASKMLQFIPTPNLGANEFSTEANKLRLNDDKGSGRIDISTARYGTFSAYYFADIYNLDNPYPSGFGGATLPGPNGAFDALSSGSDQMIVLSNTKTFGSNLVNEAHVGYIRLNNNLGVPKGGVGVSLADQGISSGPQGIQQGFPQFAGVETLYFNSFAVGTNPFFVAQVNNTFDFGDTVSKAIGNHTLKFGGQYIWYAVKQAPDLVANGTFSFFGSGAQSTGNGFADFLLGLPDFYSQQSSPPFHEFSATGGIFVEDSWRVRSNLTVNYGLRWDYIRGWSEEHNQGTTLISGVESQTFPGAPLGYLVPGDRLPNGQALPSTLAYTPMDDFSPRLGLAYSPNWSEGFLGTLTGGPGKTSIRVGAGRFFTSIEGLTIAYPTGNPPYGLTYTSPAPPEMATPFVGALTGTQFLQQFPVQVPVFGHSPSNPDPNVPWARYTPISGAVSYFYKNPTPYSMALNFTVERQITANTMVSAGYVGSLGRHLLTVVEANPGNPALCLGLSQPQEVAPGSPTCGPFGENLVYTRADGTVVNGTRNLAGFPNTIGTDAYFKNIGNSNYNALDLTLKHTSGRLTMLASYTYGKSLDDSSNLQEQVNPFNTRAEYGISAYDIKHNFVFSYNYNLPVEKLFRVGNRLTEGWAISGVTRFATGLPVTLASNGDNFLVDAQNNGINSVSIDLPNVVAGNLELNHNPRNGQPYFNTALFSPNALGTQGNAARRPFYGPGINNFDMALHKVTKLTENKSFEFRFETFNTFNHAQFDGSGSVDGNINDATFGQVVKAAPPRISQVALKFLF
ncbi:MAG TPA: carboxypeptidase regulatory-like domain-containing protein [Candidatus Acidoferrales bacterium]